MNKEKFQAIISRIEINQRHWGRILNNPDLMTYFTQFAQDLSGHKLNQTTARYDTRIWLDLSWGEMEALYELKGSVEDLKLFLNNDNYDSLGYDRAGKDRQGYDKNGFNSKGYNRAEYNRQGFNKFGFNMQGFNLAGFNRQGFDADNLDINNKPKPKKK